MSEQIIAMVRNFPRHVGEYDARLPEESCGEENYDEQCAYRAGWSAAVGAINRRITKMQQEGEAGDEVATD
jgi:hypothetical protein